MSRIRVFIADDSAIIRKMVKSFISKGQELELVGEAPDGREAVKLCKQAKPDVVLLDVNMPVMNGIDAAKLLSYSLPEAILVALSGVDDIDMMREAMVAGAKDFIRKPFKAAEFNAKVKEIWDREQKRLLGGELAAETPNKLILMCGARQGVGSTTLLTNIAVSLAVHRGRSVLVADGDVYHADITAALGCEGGTGLIEMLQQDDKSFEGLKPYINETGFNVQLIGGPALPQDPSALDPSSFAAMLSELQKQYEVVCVDLQPYFNRFWNQAVSLDEPIYLVVSNDAIDIRSARRVVDYLRSIGCSDDRIKLIYNVSRSGEAIPANEVSEAVGVPVTIELPHDVEHTRASQEKGKPFILDNNGPLCEGLEKLIELIYS